MQIKRDYSQPFFGSARRRKRGSATVRFLLGVLIGGVLLVFFTQFERLQTAALDAVGLAPTPTPLPSDLATRAMERSQAGDLASAAAYFEQALAERPDDVNYLYEYGQILIDLDDFTRGIEQADHIIAVAPRDPRGYALKTRGLVWAGDAASAISVGTVGLSFNADFAPVHAALARAYATTGRFQDALTHGERAVMLDPFYADAHRSYAYALSAVKLNDEAIDQLELAIALNPNRAAPYFELAFQYLALDRNEEAIATYDRVLSFQPNNAKALLRQCLAYSKVGQFDRAIGFCQDATQRDPNYTAAYQQLGIILYNRLDFAGALNAFEQCAAIDPANLECQYRVGLSHYYLKDCDTAWRVLQDSLLMAQKRTGQETAIEHIRQGLSAITTDCPGYGGRLLAVETTPEAETGGQ